MIERKITVVLLWQHMLHHFIDAFFWVFALISSDRGLYTHVFEVFISQD